MDISRDVVDNFIEDLDFEIGNNDADVLYLVTIQDVLISSIFFYHCLLLVS